MLDKDTTVTTHIATYKDVKDANEEAMLAAKNSWTLNFVHLMEVFGYFSMVISILFLLNGEDLGFVIECAVISLASIWISKRVDRAALSASKPMSK